ncbi:MAG: excinuclease ABC subunit UvrB [Chitinivibrionales bacterium]|nr:excinuclease ABC subunit UvrB [Chitinivibrionales bacterium]
MNFKLESVYTPTGDQPQAIDQLVEGIERGVKHQTLLGATGTGKTFTMANVIERVQLPTIIISHNKTLAAQLYQEFKEFFPHNAVEYFVSFYDYYQPEAYIPSTDTYIEKTSEINQEIDRLRLKATSSLLSRRDVLIIASVSCIYNIGSPDSYAEASTEIEVGAEFDRRDFLKNLLEMRYERNDTAFERGKYRVRGDCIDVFPAYEDTAVRIELFGDIVDGIKQIHPVEGRVITSLDAITIFPAKHFVSTRVSMESALLQIQREMEEQLARFRTEQKLLEAQRLEQRTLYDIEMLRETGYINGIENYSRIIDGREPGSRPHTLMEFFARPFLTIIDESHASIPQIGGMYNGDRARKETLVNHGFRIPCALDNRPLQFREFEEMVDFAIYSSATPADYEVGKSEGIVVEQIIRPTGLVDPPIEIKPAGHQVDDLIGELRTTVAKKHRALVTTLTKRMSEDLSEYLETLDFRVKYLHSEIDTLERSEILRNLREGEFDVLVGINLLREGLDLPEVALVAILDADKEGFLRSTRSLIQIAGRAARNVEGRIILYADEITKSIKQTIAESERRRARQLAYNQEHNITPATVKRSIKGPLSLFMKEDIDASALVVEEEAPHYGSPQDSERIKREIVEYEERMREAAANLEFEKAAKYRDHIKKLKGGP